MPTSDYQPLAEDVSDLLRARTRETGTGRELGIFTDKTRPEIDQVEKIIEKATGTVSLSIGDDIPAALFEEAKTVVSLLAAMQIELSYFPEQVNSDRSSYQQYKDLYDEAIGTARAPGRLIVAVQNARDDGIVGVVGARMPQYSFPPAKPLNW